MSWDNIFKTYAVDTLEFIKSSKDILTTQGNLYVQELIKWEIYKNTIQAILLFFCIVLLFLFIRYIKKKYENKDIQQTDSVVMQGCSYGLIFLLTLMAFDSSLAALKAYTSPRVLVMEKLQQRIR